MACAGLLLGRCNDPDVVRKALRDRFQKIEAARIDAVIVGEQDAHLRTLITPLASAATEPC